MNKKKKTTTDKPEFSKRLLLQESMLIWIITISFIILAFVCVSNQYFGELPWLAAMCGFPWTAYGASQAFYFRKAEKENTKNGIKYETVMAGLTHDDIAMMNEQSDTPMDDSAVG
jgi:EamA domain-containing membrane protein RarD